MIGILITMKKMNMIKSTGEKMGKKIFAIVALFSFFTGTTFAQQVTGERELPDFYTPGSTLDVILNIDVQEGNEPNGLIINETPPSGWSIINSAPPFEGTAEGTYKWVFYGGNVQDIIITYTVSVPSTSSGEQPFAGRVKYNDTLGNPVDNAIAGDASILTATPSQIALAPPSLDFGLIETALVFSVTNTGGPNLVWNAETTQGWLTITRTNGVLGSGESEIITANVDRTGLVAGTHLGNINFTSTGGNSTIPVTILVGEVSPVLGFNSYPTMGGNLLIWDNPANYTGTIIFRRTGGDMTANPQNGIHYDIPGNPDGYPSTVGGGTCILKDTTGLNFFFDEIATGATVYYRIYSFSDINYSVPLLSNSIPSIILWTGIINNFLTPYEFSVTGTGTLMDGFETIIPPGSLTGTLPAELDFGIIDPNLAPLHPGLTGFANIYGVSAEDLEILPGQKIRVKIPVYQSDLDDSGVRKIEDLKVYQWNSDTRLWTRLTVVETEETDLAAPIGYITAEVTSIGAINYFALGSPIVLPGGGDDCFIATAVYGTKMAREVISLRRFRDTRLLKNRTGRAFVRWYYKHSPPVADFIRDKKILKAAVRVGLQPLLWLANRF